MIRPRGIRTRSAPSGSSAGITPDDVIRAFLARTWGPWVRVWVRLSRRTRRLVKALSAAVLLLVALGAPAHAEGSNTPAALSWINYKDSYGLTIWHYELSLDRGGPTSPGKIMWAFFIDGGWQVYRGWIALSCWLIDWTLSFAWLKWITTPAIELGDSLQKVVDQFGVGPTFLTITAFSAGLLMIRGRWVTGLFELFMALVIAALAVGILANPIDAVAGKDGALYGSRDAGLEVASGLKNDGDTTADPEETREDVVSTLVETFLRRPAQLINFGAVIDGGDCEKAYQEKVEEGPFGEGKDLLEAVGECEEDYGKVAENPNGSMAISMAALYPTAVFVLLFAIILCGAVILAGAQAVYQSLKMIIALVLALLPNGARGSLWITFASVLIAMVEVIFSVVFLTAYLLVIQNLLSGDNPIKTFFIIDVLLFVGIILFWKGRARLKAATARLAAAMARRPGEGGSGQSRLPAQGSWRPNLHDAYYGTQMAGKMFRRLGGPDNPHPANRTPASIGTGDGGTAGQLPGGGRQGPGGAAGTRVPGGTGGPGGGPLDSSSASRVLERLDRHNTTSRRLGEITKTATQMGLDVYTGGTSAAARTAARKMTTRKVIDAKLRSAQRESMTDPDSPSKAATRPPATGRNLEHTAAQAPPSASTARPGRPRGRAVTPPRSESDRIRDRIAASRRP